MITTAPPSGRSLLAATAALVTQSSDAQSRPLIIDCHCHAGVGQAMTAPWTTHARIEAAVLRREIETLGLKGLLIAGHPTRSLLDLVAELRIPVLYQNDILAELDMAAQEFPQIPFMVSSLETKKHSILTSKQSGSPATIRTCISPQMR